MFFRPGHLRFAASLARQRLLLPLAAMLIALAAGSADAGIVTSMSAEPETSGSQAPLDHSWLAQQVHLFPFLGLPSVFCDVSQHSSGTTSSSSSSTSTSGFGQSLIADAAAVSLSGLSRSGWVVPEAVQALPPLLPSGLFRPPCA